MVKAQLRWLQDRASGCGLDPAQPAFHVLGGPAPVDCLRIMYEQWTEFRLGPIRLPTGPKIPFEAKRQPFLPRLLVSHDTPLCDAFLSALRKDFLARHRDGDSLYKQPPMAIGHWVAWPSDHGPQAYGTRIDVAELDLDRNGNKQLLVHVAQPFNWRNNSYSLLVSSKTTTGGLANEIIALGKLPLPEQQTASLRIVAPPDFPSMWDWGAFDGYKSPFQVLLFQDAAYLYTFADGVMVGSWDGVLAGTANLRRIRADGSLDIRCQASVAPRASALPPPSWLPKGGQPDTLAGPAEVAEWLKAIRAMQGTEGRWAGTLHALNSLIIHSTYNWYDALVRPWDSGGPPYRPSVVALRGWIARWGFDSLSQFRLARDFESGQRAALAALARYYEHSFGVSNGKEAASAAVDNIIAASFVVSGTIGPNPKYSNSTLEKEAGALRRQVDDFVEGRASGVPDPNILRSALLIGISPAAVQAFIKAGTNLGGEKKPGTVGAVSVEPMLFYALEHPDEVRALLDGGADINEGNAFGKTALMYAAHYDLADTVTLLLGHGADVTKRTNARNADDTSIQFDSRTALMYAAENASERVIRALIEAGSDACAIDTGNRDVWSYVQRSRRLSNDDRARVALLIAQQPCTPREPRDQAR